MRLKEARNRENMNVQEAWATILTLKNNQVLKRDVLFSFLVGEPNEWTNRIITVSRTFSKGEKMQDNIEPLTRGQLIARFGEEEAVSAINKNKYKVTRDDDGDVLYLVPQKKYKRWVEGVEEMKSSRI